MSYKLILRQGAERDLIETYKWYNEKVPGLGADFIDAVERALESIQANLARFPVIYRKIRRALLRRFPYGVFFVLDGKKVASTLKCSPITKRPTRQPVLRAAAGLNRYVPGNMNW